MDVSILQHSRDSSPQQVAVAEVVELIRGSQWPPGYQPLLIAASVVMGGRLRKHVRWLTELGCFAGPTAVVAAMWCTNTS